MLFKTNRGVFFNLWSFKKLVYIASKSNYPRPHCTQAQNFISQNRFIIFNVKTPRENMRISGYEVYEVPTEEKCGISGVTVLTAIFLVVGETSQQLFLPVELLKQCILWCGIWLIYWLSLAEGKRVEALLKSLKLFRLNNFVICLFCCTLDEVFF